ncbi:MAG: hypothetical protein J5574_02875 [Lachnospiraceae bacterium]|nr:hypothetical protein [Lachnospiraceae bacterium]
MIKGIDNYQNNLYTRIQNTQNDAALKKINEQAAEVPEKKQEEAKGSALDLRLEDIRPRVNASLEDISLSLNEPKSFEMKGRDSDIETLDMEKAVSDMQKDQALMQYQYFVGDTNLFSSEDGVVIAK